MRRLVAALGLLLAAGRADAALPEAPVDVRLPATVREGERVELSIHLQGHAPAARSDESIEIHVVQLPLASRPLRYLGPDRWRETPVAYRTTLAALGSRPMSATWQEPGPPGWTSLLVTFSTAGTGPGQRLGWRYAPRLVTAYVKARTPSPFPVTQAVSLGTLALAASAVVTWMAVRRTDKGVPDTAPRSPERSPDPG